MLVGAGVGGGKGVSEHSHGMANVYATLFPTTFVEAPQ